jgi:Icc-related predicted phosphoesterase
MRKELILEKINKLVQYSSDLHLEKGFKRTIQATKPMLILCGDIGYVHRKSYEDFLLNEISSNFDKVFVISGNHEYDNCNFFFSSVDEKIENICAKRNNIFYLQKKSFTISIEDDINLIGCTLWSNLPKSKKKLHEEHKNWISNILFENPYKNYVVATHHCPLFECLKKNNNKRVSNYFASDQTKLVIKNNVIMWIHGHSHINRNFIYKNKWIVSNQFGSYKNHLVGYI